MATGNRTEPRERTPAAWRADPEFLRGLVQGARQAVREAEMTAPLGADRDERTGARLPQRHHAAHAQAAGWGA